MDRWIKWRIQAASWRGLAIWIGLIVVYSYWAFFTASPWTVASAESPGLPEMAPGFHAGQPEAALHALGDARSAYLQFQLADLVYTALNTLIYATVFGLVLRRFGWSASPARYSLVLPLIYAGAEIVENTLLALMAGGLAPPAGLFALVQQAATTLKLAAGAPAGLLSLIGLVALVIAALAGLLRRKA